MVPISDWIAQLLQNPDLLMMDHGQAAQDMNLGLGWIYYSMARVVRPSVAVVIGSYRGFVLLMLARAC